MTEGVNPFQQLVQHAEAFRTNWQIGGMLNPEKHTGTKQEIQERFERDLFDLLMLAMKCQQELNRR